MKATSVAATATALASAAEDGTKLSSIRPGALRAPNELGRHEKKDDAKDGEQMTMKDTVSNKNESIDHSLQAGAGAAMMMDSGGRTFTAPTSVLPIRSDREPAMSCLLIHGGMEVIFATTQEPRLAVYGICARTRLVFQSLDLPPSDIDNNDDDIIPPNSCSGASGTRRIVSIVANQTTGIIVVAMSDGAVQTYRPVPTDPAVHSYGRFRWIDSVTIQCRSIFYDDAHSSSNTDKISRSFFKEKRLAQPGEALILSSSCDKKLLVAHRNQLAVFDITDASSFSMPAEEANDKPTTPSSVVSSKRASSSERTAQLLLWTTLLPGPVVTASISGDGQALAVSTNSKLKVGEKEANHGVHTFVRDYDDGSALESTSTSNFKHTTTTTTIDAGQIQSPIGILYKQGPFLQHSQSITSLSFRGVTGFNDKVVVATATKNDAGERMMASNNQNSVNDLLLTFCNDENIARIFQQQDWEQLVQWETSLRSRVDWLYGARAFNLGDLETYFSNDSSTPPTRSDLPPPLSMGNSDSFHRPPHYHSPPLSITTSEAGVWVAETSFSGTFPAIHLSRMSFIKRGNQRAALSMLESVSSMLPKGSLHPEAVLAGGDEVLSIRGIWSAWNTALKNIPCYSTGKALDTQSSGLSSHSLTGNGSLGGHYSPPDELRIIGSHAVCGNIFAAEFSLWATDDLVDLEYGNPICNNLLLPGIDNSKSPCENQPAGISSFTPYGSGMLTANIRPGGCIINLAWRNKGTLSVYSEEAKSTADMTQDILMDSKATKNFTDSSLVPVPILIPPVIVPRKIMSGTTETVKEILWWPDDKHDSPLLIIAVTSAFNLVIFEVLPAWSTYELSVPDAENYQKCISGNLKSESVKQKTGRTPDVDCKEELGDLQEYNVRITPDSDFGLGLRLESQMEGLPAIAGSFKKHPLTGGALPAEKTGAIAIGDELLSVNGICLEDASFDKIIGIVRQAGASAEPGSSLCMKFRKRNISNSKNLSSGEDYPDGPLSHATRNTLHSREDPTSRNTLLGGESNASDGCCRLVARSQNVFPVLAELGKSYSKNEHFMILVPLNSNMCIDEATYDAKKALLFLADGDSIHARLVEISNPDNFKINSAADFHLSAKDSQPPIIQGMKMVEKKTSHCCLAVQDNARNVRLIFVYYQIHLHNENPPGESTTITFEEHIIFNFDNTSYKNCIMCSHGIDLLATGQMQHNKCFQITVWEPNPHPAGRNHSPESKIYHYGATRIAGQQFGPLVDISFLQPKGLDTFPHLAVFFQGLVQLHQKISISQGWVALLVLSYSSLPCSQRNHRLNNPSTYSNPVVSFPHINDAVRLSVDAVGDTRRKGDFLRADWHPESLLARIYTNDHGPNHGLLEELDMFLEFARFVSQNGHDDYKLMKSAHASVLLHDAGDNALASDLGTSNKSLGQLKESKAATKKNFSLLHNLQQVLLKCCFGDERQTAEIEDKDKPTTLLPPPLRSFSNNEISFLWALGEILVGLLTSKASSVDQPGDFFIFTSKLLGCMKTLVPAQKPPTLSLNKEKLADLNSTHQLPSAAALFAALSNSQAHLLEHLRGQVSRIDWDVMNKYHVPLWIRSNKALVKLCEEVGQNTFRGSRDIMECALFFIISGKLQTLRNLAATDSSDKGRKFYNFLSNQDFSSDRGRQAAEKNAYSLLRKRKYQVAASFFLLSKPPLLKSALEVICTQMKDLNLAFLVARLMELPANAAVGSLAGFGMDSSLSPGESISENYSDWQPNLKSVAVTFILERGLSHSADDNCLTALQLLWIGKREEASFWLSGLSRNKNQTTILPDFGDLIMPGNFETGILRMGKGVESVSRIVSFLNFLSGPAILKYMAADARPKCASALTLASTLMRYGMEKSSTKLLLCDFDRNEVVAQKDREKASASTKEEKANLDTKLPSSLEADSPSKPAFVNVVPTSPQMKSSIADCVNGTLSAKTPTRNVAPKPCAGQMKTIFNNFDPAPLSRHKVTASPSASQAGSSIFDSFDVAPLTKKATNAAPKSRADQMESSIFDNFDIAPLSKLNVAPSPSVNQMGPTVFDSFDAPLTKHASNAAPRFSAGQVESSIFDSFDAAPRTKPFCNEACVEEQSSPIAGNDSVALKPPKEYPEECELQIDSIKPLPVPQLWDKWRDHMLVSSVARRVIRELSCLMVDMYGAGLDSLLFPNSGNNTGMHFPQACAEMLQSACKGERFIEQAKGVVMNVCDIVTDKRNDIIRCAIQLLGAPHENGCLFYSVVLNLVIDRCHLAEDCVRATAQAIMNHCYSFALSNNPVAVHKKSKLHVDCLLLQRQLIPVCWQLELCLWLQRGGGLPLSEVAAKEATIAVRLGFVIGMWTYRFECLECMIKCEPDCLTDINAGQQMWTSLKTMGRYESKIQALTNTNRGGWEFLLKCTRSEATNLLRHKHTGCFIIRPHAEDHCVFTLSFKTNLDSAALSGTSARTTQSKSTKKSDAVQHAIIRLADAGFRCGSFGPFKSLLQLLKAVSNSLPFNLRFHEPPLGCLVQEKYTLSPNAAFLKNLVRRLTVADSDRDTRKELVQIQENEIELSKYQQQAICVFSELSTLLSLRKSLCGIAMARHPTHPGINEENYPQSPTSEQEKAAAASKVSVEKAQECNGGDHFTTFSRTMRPFLSWCRSVEMLCESVLRLDPLDPTISPPNLSEEKMIYHLLEPKSGMNLQLFSLADGSVTTLLVLFSKDELIEWILKQDSQIDRKGALKRFEYLENHRFLELINFSTLQSKAKPSDEEKPATVYCRVVDPWEVEPLNRLEERSKSATVGRDSFFAYSSEQVSRRCERALTKIGGRALFNLWTATNAEALLTQALACAPLPWMGHKDSDVCCLDGTEPAPYLRSIQLHLYRNRLFRSLYLPQRFLAVLQVELLDLKNLTAPESSSSLSVFALLRMRRSESCAKLTNRTSTLDIAVTPTMKIARPAGPNAPATWGSVVWFRFPLPEGRECCPGSCGGFNRETSFTVCLFQFCP